MSIVIKGGKIVTSTDIYCADLVIENGKIVTIGRDISLEYGNEIDATGRYIFPGAIDPHTHFDLEAGSTVTADDFESGTKAAILGGTTTIVDFVNHVRGESLRDALNKWNKKVKGNTYCDYGFHMTIAEWNEDISNEMKDMVEEGIPSFKMYMAYKKTLQVDDATILKALKRSGEVGGLIAFHCENGDMVDFLVEKEKRKKHYSPYYHLLTRPIEVEEEAISRLLALGKIAEVPVYIVHLSSKKGLEKAIRARSEGQKVYIETCPQYLLLDDSYYGVVGNDDFEAAKYVLSPPLRKKEDLDSLWNGLGNNYIDVIATDHCSFNYNGQKSLGEEDFSKIPNGIPGVEHRLSLMYTYGVLNGKISLNQMVALTSTNAAKIYGMFPRKGTISVGSDGDIVIWNPNLETTITASNQNQNVDYTPYEGFEINGGVEHVFLRGQQVVKDFRLVEDDPIGKFIRRDHC